LLRFTVKWSVLFLLIICVIISLQACLLTWMIP
jgi:L-lactate permease